MGFDPVKMAFVVERQAYRTVNGVPMRRYARFRRTKHYGGNVAGDVAGCNLRCAFCWAWPFAFNARRGRFYSPREAAYRISRAGPYRIARLTGGEPLIGWPHTREVARILVSRGYLFILETNGILLGGGHVLPDEIPRGVHVRVSIKAPSREFFEKVTGADPAGWDLQLRAVERLVEYGMVPGRDFHVAVVLGVAPPSAYSGLIDRLAAIDSRIVESLEEEVVFLYDHVRGLIKKRELRLYLYYDPVNDSIVRD